MLKLSERKLTTKKGIEELHEFLKNFAFDADIPDVESEITFFARIDLAGSEARYDFSNCTCKFKVTKGNLKILAEIMNDCADVQELDYDVCKKRISFMDCIASFTSVVEKYNKEVIEVEKGIETFLNFISMWNQK